jgi:hypothetical protein
MRLQLRASTCRHGLLVVEIEHEALIFVAYALHGRTPRMRQRHWCCRQGCDRAAPPSEMLAASSMYGWDGKGCGAACPSGGRHKHGQLI